MNLNCIFFVLYFWGAFKVTWACFGGFSQRDMQRAVTEEFQCNSPGAVARGSFSLQTAANGGYKICFKCQEGSNDSGRHDCRTLGRVGDLFYNKGGWDLQVSR